MAHGKSLELADIEKPEPEGICVKCRTPWSTHMTQKGTRRKKFEGDEHQNSAWARVGGFYVAGATNSPQAGPFPDNRGRSRDARPRRSKPTVSWVVRERAERQMKAALEATRAEADRKLRLESKMLKQGRKRG